MTDRMPRLTRRTLLRAGGLTALVGAAASRRPLLPLPNFLPVSDVVDGTVFDILVARPSDGLRLLIKFNNVEVVGGMVQPVIGTSWYSVTFPSQHLQENAIAAGTGINSTPKGQAARGSRLVFTVDDPIPFTLDALLNFRFRELRLHERAMEITGLHTVEQPTDDVTSLELPTGLYLTPGESDARFHRAVQFTLDDTTEVFVAKLGRRFGATNVVFQDDIEVRALWTPGYTQGAAIADVDDGFPLDRATKKRIVRATSDYQDADYPDHEPAIASRLWLTSAGGYLDVVGAWDSNAQLAAWEQKVRAGRDTFVKVVNRGYLLPFGHAATVIDVTERTFVLDDGVVTTQLETTTYLSLNQGRSNLPTGKMPDDARGFPFVAAELIDEGLFVITKDAIPGVPATGSAFLALLDGDTLLLRYALTDRVDANDQPVAASFPAIWVGADHAFNMSVGSVLDNVRDWLSDDGLTQDLRNVDFGGQRVGYTDESTSGSGRTTFQTDTQRWTFEFPTSGTAGVGFPAIVPRLDTASVASPSLDALLDTDLTFVDVSLDPAWIDFGNLDGVGENPLLNALVLDVTREVRFEALGSGIASPTFNADIFNQTIGFAPSDLVPNANFDMLDFLGDLPKLLGVLDLGKLLDNVVQAIPSTGFGDLPTIPGFQIDIEDVGGIPSKVVATFHWETELASWDGNTDAVIFEASAVDTNSPTLLVIDAVVCVPLDGSAPDTEFNVYVENFAINVPPNVVLIRFSFHEVRLTFTPGEGLVLTPDIDGIRFEGVMTLLEAVQPLLQFKGGGLELEEHDDAVEALVRISLPNINLGILAIRNITIAAGANIPLVPNKQFESVFEFGTKANPVTVLVMGYGGGFHVEFTAAPSPGTVDLIRLGINVTMEQSLNVVVAKGTLSASFGAYLEVSGDDLSLNVVLGAYVEVTGSVKVLGIVTITVGASVELTYTENTKTLKGTATIYASVDTPLGSKEVSFSVEQKYVLGGNGARKARLGDSKSRGRSSHSLLDVRQPGGSLGGDGDDSVLTLADRYDQQTWQSYCEAFGETP